MSLHHRNLAEIWATLQGRHDIGSILREIIGQHTIDSTLQDGNSQSVESSVQTVIWIKTIFDLQRCYLSGIANGVAECPPYITSCLLPAELLLTTILYLLNVKTRSFSSQTTLMTREFTRSRHILAQTVLCGLRLVQLRRERVAARDKRRLQTALNAAWQDDRLHGVERFIVAELYALTLDAIDEPRDESSPRGAYKQEWLNARLPTFAAGLYPLDIRPETFVTPLIHGVMEEDWIDAYWVLFDCLWAMECAVVQRYVDLRRQGCAIVTNQAAADTDEILEQLYQTRTSLIVSIFHITGPMTPPSPLLESLAATLLDWNEDLDSFLLRQDSLLEHRSTMRPPPPKRPNFGRYILEMSSCFDGALGKFLQWLSTRKSGYEQFSTGKPGLCPADVHSTVKDWVSRITSSRSELLSEGIDSPLLPVYIVDCPKLHVIPKRILEYKLRWCDKWAFESIQENSPIVNWKEGVQCPSCPSEEKIKLARLLEPLQQILMALDSLQYDDYNLSQHSFGDSGSYDATSTSVYSRSTSEAEGASVNPPIPSTLAVNPSAHISHPRRDHDVLTQRPGQPPSYSESPISPTTFIPPTQRPHSHDSSHIEYPVSPLNESLNVPIPSISRFSMELPIPINTPATISDNVPEYTSASVPSDISSIRLDTPSTDSMWSGASSTKQKSSSRTIRIANSIRRKPTTKTKEAFPLPKEPSFVFSSSGHSLLLWGKGTNHVVRFDIPSNDISAMQGCKYEMIGIEAVAAGNNKCVIIATNGLRKHRLAIFDGISLTPEFETDIDFSERAGDLCLAVSRNDNFIAISINDQIQIFNVEDGIKQVSFRGYELQGGTAHHRTNPIGGTSSDEPIPERRMTDPGVFGTQQKGLSSKEVAEEQERQSAIVSRKLCFSTDSKQLVVATHLGDHWVYVDVWDCTREPVRTISEHSRSFKMPPWTLNDGDLTSVFYDSIRKSAIVTAFVGKEYPVLIPLPSYDTLQNETYSTKIVHAAQSPSGKSFIVANAMTEMVQFEYTTKGTLSPRKLKKSSAKISNSMFKPGAIALAMPLENVLQCFWIKDGKCMFRSVKTGTGEAFRDYDIRPHFDRLMSLKTPIIARAPSLLIPEMDAT